MGEDKRIIDFESEIIRDAAQFLEDQECLKNLFFILRVGGGNI